MQCAAVSSTFGLMNCAVHSTMELGSFCVGVGMTSMPTHLSGARLGLPVVASGGAVSGTSWATRISSPRAFGGPPVSAPRAFAPIPPAPAASAIDATARRSKRIDSPSCPCAAEPE